MKNNISQLGKGAKHDKTDDRDLIFEALGGMAQPLSNEEWKEGYNIEKVIGHKIPFQNQFGSYSCVGQAFAYYVSVLNAIETGKYEMTSAKAIYSLISLGFKRGAYLRDGAKLIVNFGALLEEVLPSYLEDGTTNEEFMIKDDWQNKELERIADILKSKRYYLVTGLGIDVFARAIKEGFGMVAGVDGYNDGNWNSFEPKPPTLETLQRDLWGHALYFGKFGIDEKGKYIATPNSWGTRGNDKLHPDGWQKLREDYFENNNRFVFNPWVLIDRKNIMTNSNVKILKDKNSSAVGVWLPAISPQALTSYCLNFGIEAPRNEKNEIDWEAWIEGDFELRK